MDKEYFEVCLCSLLHDIGKFAWRVASKEECVSSKGKPLSHEDWNKKIVQGTPTSFPYWEKVNQPLNNCVLLGDWISAQERDDLDETEKENAKKEDFKRIKLTPLISSFSLISLRKENNERKIEEEVYVKHRNLSLNLPSKEDFLNKQNKLNHKFDRNLFGKFVKEIREALSFDFDVLSEDESNKLRFAIFRIILDILRKYLIYIPSATAHSKSDIDLYNHSKISCAITACLYKLYKSDERRYASFLQELREEMNEIFKEMKKMQKEKDKDRKEKLKKIIRDHKEKQEKYNKKVFLLIKGDFSGIQDFISTISSQNAIKHLKARSFYLAFLNKLIPLKIIKELDLPETNIIFVGGGNFEILAPNIETLKEKVIEIVNEINEHFWKHFGIKIFLNISYKELSAKDFDRDFFNKLFDEKETEEKILLFRIDKKRKFNNILEKIINENGEQNLSFGGEECEICHKEIKEIVRNEKKCEECKNFEKTRNNLKLWQANNKIIRMNNNLFILNKKNLFDYINYFTYSKKEKKLISISPYLNKIEGIYEIFPTGLPFNDESEIIEFDDLAKKAEEGTGTRKIAALKLDVDNLGKIFAYGLKDNLTLSLYSRLSFDFDLFFSGIIETLRNQKKFKDEIYIVYSGGDDTFVIGSWDKVLDFAKEVLRYFRIYVNQHPDITISASYNLFDPKYPVRKIFEIMERDLEKSKSFNEEEKAKISLFGFPLRWDKIEEENNLSEELINKWLKSKKLNEFEVVTKISSYLLNLINDKKKLTRTFLSKAIYLADEIIYHLEKEKIEANLIPVYRFNYYLKRNIKCGKKVEEDEDFKLLDKLWERFCFADINEKFKNESNNFAKNIKKLELLKIAIKLVLLKTRKRKNE